MRHKLLILITALIVSVLVGIMGATAIVNYYAYNTIKSQLTYERSIYAGMSYWYGVVEETRADGSLLLKLENRHRPGGNPVLLRLRPAPEAYIGRQDVLRDKGGVIVGLTPVSEAKIEDIKSGMRVAVGGVEDGEDKTTAVVHVIIFGNPL